MGLHARHQTCLLLTVIDTILGNLNKVKPSGNNRWMACCPGHDDKSPSLIVTDAGDRILLHCYAGCPTESVVGAIGMTMGDLFLDDEDPERRQARRERLSKEGLFVEKMVLEIAAIDRQKGKKLSAADLKREREAYLAIKRIEEDEVV